MRGGYHRFQLRSNPLLYSYPEEVHLPTSKDIIPKQGVLFPLRVLQPQIRLARNHLPMAPPFQT